MDTFNMTEETPLSLGDAASFLPKRSNGKKINSRTIERWIRHGHRGILLEGCLLGRMIYTSRESLQRFSEKLAGNRRRRAPAVASRSHERAKRTLEKAGFKAGK